MTLLIIAVTFLVSYVAFQRQELLFKYDFNPYQIIHRNQWYRLVTHAFLHADWMHLIVNMLVFYSFADVAIYYFQMLFAQNATLLFLGLYFGGIIVSCLYSLVKQRDNYNYSAIGASGGVAAVTFTCILFEPLGKILFFGVIPIPGVLFGILYLAYSYYMGKRGMDNVAHDAHFYGAVFGFVYPLIFRPDMIVRFIEKIIP
jgi:membrane associated rhomboid family serine protease